MKIYFIVCHKINKNKALKEKNYIKYLDNKLNMVLLTALSYLYPGRRSAFQKYNLIEAIILILY